MSRASRLGWVRLWQLYDSVERHDLKYPPYKPRLLSQFQNVKGTDDIFAAIRQEDLLIHHPYDSFRP